MPYTKLQDGKPKLIAYMSKRIPEATKNYSITELKMCGLAINIASFAHLLKRVDFDAVVDHLAIMHIMKSKMEPTTNKIKGLLEILSSYSFNLYYLKGQDVVLSDFLSRQMEDDSDLHGNHPNILYYKGNTERKLPKHGKRHIHGADKVTYKNSCKHLYCTEHKTNDTKYHTQS